MIKIPAVNGVYELECDSNGTYHEIVAKLSGTFAAKASVSILRLGSSQVELLNSLPVYVDVVSSGLKLDLYIATLQLTQLKRMLRWAR